VQAFTTWSPPGGTLGAIIDEARERARALRASEGELAQRASGVHDVPPFAERLRGPTVALIAEVKRKSPSKGWIRPDLDAASQARSYEEAGAAAISVLTEPNHFAGSCADLVAVRGAVSLPTLKKDFHVHPVQLLEAKALGASAALLIARAIGPRGLTEMMRKAESLALEVLVEVRDQGELEQALELGARVIGINNRNLETLAIDTSTSERLLRSIPESIIAIAESGMASRSDVARAASAGAHAVLVGSSLSGAGDAAEAVRALTGVKRSSRAG
jgi:indole-3-glycerol phosphate synthase